MAIAIMSSVGSSPQRGDIWVIVGESTVWLSFVMEQWGEGGGAFHKTARTTIARIGGARSLEKVGTHKQCRKTSKWAYRCSMTNIHGLATHTTVRTMTENLAKYDALTRESSEV